MPAATQITLFWRSVGCYGSEQVTAHIGGYRAVAVTSDHHAARPTFQSVSEPSAD
jgi:hypothetical protein